MNLFPQLETQNLLLREIADTDAEALLSIHGNAQHMKWFGSDPLTDIDGARSLIQTFAKWREEPASGTRWGLQLKSCLWADWHLRPVPLEPELEDMRAGL